VGAMKGPASLENHGGISSEPMALVLELARFRAGTFYCNF